MYVVIREVQEEGKKESCFTAHDESCRMLALVVLRPQLPELSTKYKCLLKLRDLIKIPKDAQTVFIYDTVESAQHFSSKEILKLGEHFKLVYISTVGDTLLRENKTRLRK